MNYWNTLQKNKIHNQLEGISEIFVSAFYSGYKYRINVEIKNERTDYKMGKYKRYGFVDWNGNQKGLENTDSLMDAIQDAIEFQCEVIDTQAHGGNQIVYSAWDGWNIDYDFYNKDIADFIMSEIKVKEKEQIEKKDSSDTRFSAEELNLLSLGILSMIDSTNKAFGLIYDGDAKEILSRSLKTYRDLNNKVCRIWGEAPDYKG